MYSSAIPTISRQRQTLSILFALLCFTGPSLGACPVSCLFCPCFSSSPYTFEVDENSPIGTVVSTLSATSPSGLSLMYSLDSLDFNLESVSGNLTVAVELDYETTSTYQLSVSATDGSYTGRAQVTVLVLNRNDFPPECSSSVVYFRVSEEQHSVNLQLPNCTDRDVPSNPDISYSVMNGGGLFRIDQGGQQLTVVQALDYEAQQIYDLTVTVRDTVIPPGPLQTTIRVVVTVDPVNEFRPVFSMPQFVFSFAENAAIGSTVGQISATDGDSGDDGLLYYSINTVSTIPFIIDSKTGYLVTTRSLDFETTSSYSFAVTASDSSESELLRLTSSINVVVNVLDVNDNGPVFLQPVYYREVPENSRPGVSVLLRLVCRDLDSGPNREMLYSITSGNNEDVFQIDSSSGNVSLMSTLDYDDPRNSELFTLMVQCQEVVYPFRVADTIVLLEVTSYNEFDPLPMAIEYEMSISENTIPGTAILTVEASDRDRGLAGTLRYFFNFGSVQLSTCPSDLVSIDETSGIVYLLSHLDYESGLHEVHCIVTIWDSEVPSRPSEADVWIYVLNANDVGPKCYPAISTVYVSENSLIGDTLFTLPCNDSDSRQLYYTVVSQTVLPFQVDQDGGLFLQSSLDYETKSSYIFTVTVSDGMFVVNNSVYILVININEYAPVFTQDNYECFILENASLGTRLSCDIQATDDDSQNEGVVNYRLSLSTPSELFMIDESTGDVLLAQPVDCESQAQYNIVIEVYDLGSPSMSATTNVLITVLDVNDNSPEMIPIAFSSILENSPVGTGITTVVCTDADQGSNAQTVQEIFNVVQFSEGGGSLDRTTDMLFSMNPVNGVVIVSGIIDYEVAHLYKLLIICRDGGTPSLSALSTLLIDVTSVNEYEPVFEDTPVFISVPENTMLGEVIHTFVATDRDRGVDGTLVYSLNSTASLPFTLNEQSGVLTLSEVLDCDLALEYTFSLVLQDGGQPSQSAQTMVSVVITDCHLGQVVPTQTVYMAHVVENASFGTLVQTVTCSSTRINLNTQIEPAYEIATDQSDLFEIGSSTGDITLVQSPDFEEKQSHVITCRCYDPNHPSIVSHFLVHVIVLPVNEHPPEFIMDNFILTVSEGTPIGAAISRLEASDEDDGKDGVIMYTIVGESSSNFIIDSLTGELFLTASLDRETAEELMFIAIVQDMPTDEASRQTSSATVTIHVSDTNDNWPRCARMVYHLSVSPQTTPPHTLLASPDCVDMDSHENGELEYELGGNLMEGIFQVDQFSGALILTADLNLTDSIHYYMSLVVRDKGVPPLSTTVLVIIDVQEPALLVNVDTNDRDYHALVEAEGINNSVSIVLEDFSNKLWESVSSAEDSFHKAVANSVTNYCALFPEGCSLISECSSYDGTRKKREVEDNFAMFTKPTVVVLSKYTIDHMADTSGATLSLQVEFYVSLPSDACRSPYRQTNYVVPRATLNLIVEQDSQTIEALVRTSVAPPLTQRTPVDGWLISTFVLAAVLIAIFSAVLISAIGFTAYLFKKRQYNKVVILTSSKKKTADSNSGTTSTSKRESKCSNISSLSGSSNRATCGRVRNKLPSFFFAQPREESRRESNDTARCFETPSDISEVSMDSEGASMENHPSRPTDRFGRTPREMLDTLRDSKGLMTPERTISIVSAASNVNYGNRNGRSSFSEYTAQKTKLWLNVPD